MKRALFAAACCALMSGCASRADDSGVSASEWLASMHAAHDRADAALAAGDPERARAALSGAVALPAPPGVRAQDARAVQQDLLFRVAQIELERGDARAALQRSERGLALGREHDLFDANLLLTRGRALAALGRDIEAASSYQEALEINARLLRRALGQAGAGEP